MKRVYTRLSVVFLAVALSLSLCAPACMAVEYTSTGTFWQSVASKGPGFMQAVLGHFIFTGACSVSSDAKHHANAISADPNSKGNYEAICEYCSKPFFLTEAQLLAAYADYTANINTTYGSSTFGSDGSIYWIPKFDYGTVYVGANTQTAYYYGNTSATSTLTDFTITIHSEYNPMAFSGFYNGSGGVKYRPPAALVNVKDVAPVTGYYTVVSACASSGYYLDSSGVKKVVSSERVWNTNSSYMSAGAPVVGTPCVPLNMEVKNGVSLSSFYYSVEAPLYRIQPLAPPSIINQTDTRTGSLSGNFGYYGDNGQLIAAENMTIVNETNNTYTNPQTGTTSPVTNWTYDYSNRSYKLTLESGDTVNVTYGDENVTIKEGDTVYNIYYITQGGGTGPGPSPTPGPGGCAHKYTSTVTTAPACLTAGVKTFTCSLCSDTYTEKTPATGHTWVLDRTVNSEYDTDGKVTVQGYSIYKCSVCGNEYKDTEGTGPPDSGGESGGGFLDWLLGKIGELLGSIGNGVLTLLKTALGKIFDGVIGIIDMITEKLSQILDALFKIFDNVPKMFDGFTLFLTNCFAFLPPEIMTFLTFGVLAMVLIAIFRFFLGK